MQKMTAKEATALINNPNIPFSPLLNRFISLKFELLPFAVKYEPGQPYDTFGQMKDEVEKRGFMRVSTDFSERTIFGHPLMNWKFRAVHDSYHIKHNMSFSVEDERTLNDLCINEWLKFGLPLFETALLEIEMRDQVNYLEKYGTFPEDQRIYTLQRLNTYGILDCDKKLLY